MELIEKARMIFRDLEENNPQAASEIARRAFRIQDQLSDLRS